MITPSYAPIVGGTEVAVENLTINLNKQGIPTDIMTFNMDDRWNPKWEWKIEEKEGFKIYKVPAVNIFPKIHIPNFISYLFRLTVFPDYKFRNIFTEYDILHFHDEVDISFSLFSLLMDKPKIFHIHTLQETFQTYKYNLISRNILKSHALHITASHSNEVLMDYLGADWVEVLPNGVDSSKFNYNLDEGESNLILFVGRFERRKGIHVLLDSLKYLKNPVKLVIIAPEIDNEYFNEIMIRIAEENKNKKHAILYLGSLSQGEIVKWQHKATLLACPSLTEDFGMVIVEAMSCGTPVIASQLGGITDIIDDGENGLLVPGGNPEKLAEAVMYLLGDENLQMTLAHEARKKVEKEYTWDAVVRKLRDIYVKLLDNVD